MTNEQNTHQDSHQNGTVNNAVKSAKDDVMFTPVAICGMACRLPGGVSSPEQLWNFLLAGGDARTRVPQSRYNVSSLYSPKQIPSTVITEYGYFLDEGVEIGALDTTMFSMPRAELERLDPQQRLLLEVSRECIDDAGETGWKGRNIGVYIGSYGQDWYDVFNRDPLKYSNFQVTTTHDFMISERISHEMDLRGPSMTIRTACSSSLIGLNEACLAIARGDCDSAIVGGTSIILSPGLATAMSEQGVFSPDGSCKTFSAAANGYARGEGVVAIYVKPLKDAIRDGNPIQAVISGTATNFDGKTPTLTTPSASAQEALIRRAYQVAGIDQISRTALFECHGTGTSAGDPIEAAAVAAAFGTSGVYITSIKPNIGHTEGASGLASLLKAVLALKHRTIPPNIKSSPPNPKIPFERNRLTVPVEPMPWPVGRDERVSVNSFGVGGANAHAIIESAAGYGVSRPPASVRVGVEEPQLLVVSASSPQSLKELTQTYGVFLDKTGENFEDLAYTLANRRQHLSCKSFIVATRDKSTTVGPPSSWEASRAPSLVMVFTGQGAQWPLMGRELLRSNHIFRQSIQTLDKHLQGLEIPVPWTIAEELVKPARSSRLNEAEFSQPLCTAIQLALVDALSSIGIKCAAVVGHSSGEIAAAYAAGSLTAKEAIVVAFHRGQVSKTQTKRGAMAAVSLSWSEAKEHLLAGVVVACDNSNASVTLSGDAEQLEITLRSIRDAYPDRSATLLKVDKAYHSQHMVELGEEYHKAMASSGVEGKMPCIPFFSSVTGELLKAAAYEQLGPRYWQDNLERPVRFREAVSSILKHSALTNPVFLEIGPHSALGAPLRQILIHESSKAPHVPTLIRRQNSTESYLTMIGRLYTNNVNIDFKALMPEGLTIAGLPTYPWHHTQTHWYESRVSKEWRQREQPYHDLLGIKVAESTTVEPAWRNLLHLETVPWLCDHRIDDDIVYPFAAYVAMAAVAIEQIVGVHETIGFRHVSVSNALLLREESPTELVTTLRRHRLTDTLDSEWYEFSILSHNGHLWTRHCSGEVRGEPQNPRKATQTPENLPRKVNSRRWYEALRRRGLNYGHHFTTLEDITSSTTSPSLATARLRNNWHGDEANYHLHPVIIDSFFQILNLATWKGLPHANRRLVASSVESLTISRCSSDYLSVFSSAQLGSSGSTGEGSCLVASKIVLQASGARTLLLEDTDADEESNLPITARSEWVPHVDFKDINLLLKPRRHDTQSSSGLEEVSKLVILQCKKLAAKMEVQIPHLKKYKAWLEEENDYCPESTGNVSVTSHIEFLERQLADSSAVPVASALSKIYTNLESILSGSKKASEVLNTGDILEKFETYMKEYDNSAFLQVLGHCKPNIRVLELGAGTGSATSKALQHLTHADGQALFSRYICADSSQGIVNAGKERFKEVKNLEFVQFDIGKPLADQGFEDRQFDLIILTGVLHLTSNIQRSLRDALTLLAPNGRVLLQEPRPGLAWAKFILGTLPSWWFGTEDGRKQEPYISQQRWEEELVAAGFEVSSGLGMDSSESTLIVAKPRQQRHARRKVTIVCQDNDFMENALVQNFQARGYDISCCTLDQVPPAGDDIIAALELEAPFLEGIDEGRFENFKAFISNVDGSGILWITKPSQVCGEDPRYGLVVGLARTIRSELAIDLATCEIDNFDSSDGINAIANVFQQFQLREKDGTLGPDFEYSICGGVTRVNRIFPFALTKGRELSKSPCESFLTLGRPGFLGSLHWSEQDAVAPQGDEVEVEVYSTGLNFRDILVAMGILELPHPYFGYEASGVVRRVGPGVTKLRVGDRAALIGVKTFSTVVTATELLYEKIPDDMSFNDAAAIPIVFTTAIYCLMDIGCLTSGKSVLIHSAAGGVGLAAIQVAQMLGAEIYVTVSSDVKKTYLTETFGIPENRMFHSRSTDFVDDLLRATQGKGVDLALNSLSGELLHATWRCIAKWGTMVEIGKRDLLGHGKLDMEVFLHNRSYCCVDMDQMAREKPAEIDRLLRTMMDCFRQHRLQTIRLARVSSATAVRETFQNMQSGKHIGKIVVELRDHTGKPHLGNVQASEDTGVKLDSSASYLLVGGLGGLGRSISIWMVQRGARNLIFLSRSAGVSQKHQDLARELESMNCAVQLIQGSVTNAADVARAVDGALGPLKGIIQLSMVLRDVAFPRMRIYDWNQAIEPKVRGTWNLYEISRSRNADLDFFVLFSSLSGLIGQSGQANYASANTFLDAFVKYRQGMHLPCTAIVLGMMESVGYLTENVDLLRKIQGTGWRSNQEEELFAVLEAAMAPQRIQRLGESNKFNRVDSHSFMLGISPTENAQQKSDVRFAVYHNINDKNKKVGASNDALRTFLAEAKKTPAIFELQETVVFLASEIGKKLLSLLLRSDGTVDISSNTVQLGLDSLVAIEMRSWWKFVFNFDISVLEMLSMGTLEALGKRVAEELGALYDK